MPVYADYLQWPAECNGSPGLARPAQLGYLSELLATLLHGFPQSAGELGVGLMQVQNIGILEDFKKMRSTNRIVVIFFILLVALGSASSALAQYRLTDAQTRQLAQRIAVEANQFRRSFDQAINRAPVNNSSAEYQLRGRVGEFQLAATRLRDRINRRQATAADVQQLLEHARYIDNFMRTADLNNRAENDWSTLRNDLSTLANAANIAWNWDTNIPGGPVYGNAQLTGTYRIDTSNGDDPRTIAENATRNLPSQRRDRVYQNLLNRLSPPDVLAIDQRGQKCNNRFV